MVLISIDACRPDYFDLANIPHLRSLMARGTWYQGAWVGQLINNTPPGHATMGTGCFPRTQGILGFAWRDPSTGGLVRPTSWEGVQADSLAKILTASGVSSIGAEVKRADPSAKVAAVSSHKFYAAASLGGNSADYVLFASQAQPARQQGQRGEARPTEEAVASIPTRSPPALALAGLSLPAARGQQIGVGDEWAIEVAMAVVRSERPRVLLINLPECDGRGHATGGITAPDVMRQVLENVDKQVGRLMELYRSLGIYDETLFAITADHGMSPNAHVFAGNLVRGAINSVGTRVAAGGAVPHIWLADPSKAAEAAEAIAAAHIVRLRGVWYKIREGDQYSFYPAPTTARTLEPDVEGAYRYLANTYACPQGPDLFVALTEDTHPGVATEQPNTRGKHDTATWVTQHIPLILAGPGIKQGVVSDFPARLVDIAPTVLAAMGLPPAHMDGLVLADALENPPPTQVAATQAAGSDLTAFRDALKRISQQDLAH